MTFEVAFLLMNLCLPMEVMNEKGIDTMHVATRMQFREDSIRDVGGGRLCSGEQCSKRRNRTNDRDLGSDWRNNGASRSDRWGGKWDSQRHSSSRPSTRSVDQRDREQSREDHRSGPRLGTRDGKSGRSLGRSTSSKRQPHRGNWNDRESGKRGSRICDLGQGTSEGRNRESVRIHHDLLRGGVCNARWGSISSILRERKSRSNGSGDRDFDRGIRLGESVLPRGDCNNRSDRVRDRVPSDRRDHHIDVAERQEDGKGNGRDHRTHRRDEGVFESRGTREDLRSRWSRQRDDHGSDQRNCFTNQDQKETK